MFKGLHFGSAILAGWCLISIASAGRLRDFARRKGFGPNLRRVNSGISDERSNNSTFRFLTNDTKKFQVTSLPDIPFDVGEIYSGLIPIDMSDPSRALFFVFQPTVGQPVDEVTIWLNGGPGCRSLEGFFQENGRFIWSWGQYTPILNQYSWVNLTNVLWVEQPVGTGFSTGQVRATSQEDIARDFVNFFLNFQKTFGIKNFKIYVTGESYAGRYVPYISAAMLDRKNPEYFNLSGTLMYDPCIGSFDYVQQQVPVVPFVIKNNNVLGINSTYLAQLETLDKSCGYSEFREKYPVFPPPGVQAPQYFNYDTDGNCDLWGMAYTAAYAPNPCFNVYQIGTQCPLLLDPLGYATDLLYTYPGLPIYFNRTDVKQAMHAPIDINWMECSSSAVFLGNSVGPEGEGDSSADSIQSVLPRVIEATNRVLVSNANLDMEILSDGTLLALQNISWNGKLGFQTQPSTPIVITLPDLEYEAVFDNNGFGEIENPQGTMGVQHYERGLMWAETYLSVHMQPQFQPRSSYRHMQWLLGHIETL